MKKFLLFFCSPLALFLLAPKLSLGTANKLPDNPDYNIVEVDNKVGLANKDGEMVIPAEYEDLGWSDGVPKLIKKVIGYKKNGKWGLLHIKNKEITNTVYLELIPFKGQLIIASQSKKGPYGIIDHKGQTKLAFRYKYLEPGYKETLIAAFDQGNTARYALIRKDGSILTNFEYLGIHKLGNQLYSVVNPAGHKALMNGKGVKLTGFHYDSIAPFKEEKALTFKENRKGMIDTSGDKLVPNHYKSIQYNGKNDIRLYPFTKWQMLNGENEVENIFYFEKIDPIAPGIIKVKAGNYFNLLNLKGEALFERSLNPQRINHKHVIVKSGNKSGVVNINKAKPHFSIPAQFDSTKFLGDFIAAGIKNPENENLSGFKWYLYDHSGNKLTDSPFQKILTPAEGFFPVKQNGGWGYIDGQGEIKIACRFKEVRSFEKGRAVVKEEEQGFGIINKKGNWIIKPAQEGDYIALNRLPNGNYLYELAIKGKGKEYGILDLFGKNIYNSQYPLIGRGQTILEKNLEGGYGLITLEGKRLLNTRYDTISELQEDSLFTFTKKDKTGIIGRSGRVLVSLNNEYEKFLPYSEYRLGVKIDGKYGAIDAEGRLLIANQYENIGPFREGMARVMISGNWGFINKKERLLVQPKYDYASDFNKGLSIVGKNGKYGIINKNGEYIIDLKYDTLYKNGYGRFVCILNSTSNTRGQAVGLISKNGKSLIYPKYDAIQDLPNEFVIIERNGHYGVTRKNGVSTIPLQYERLFYDPYNNLFIGTENKIPKEVSFSGYKARPSH